MWGGVGWGGGVQVYKRRWVVLLCFCLCNAANALVWITFSPISDQVEAKFNISSTWVNMLSLVFMIVFVPITFPSAWLLDHLGLWFGVRTPLPLPPRHLHHAP